jgi:acyl dehydratase
MNRRTATAPVKKLFFEDYIEGSVHEFGALAVTREEIIAFAQRFDPQPFHTDPDRAKGSVYGGLIASGWHTGSLAMRLLVEHYLPGAASLGSPGVDELRWILPVRPGDELSVRVTVLEARRSATKPDRGVVRSFVEVLNQRREPVMSMKPVNLMRCRDASSGSG